MPRWKKILICAVLALLVMTVAFYAFLALYDFNKFKPMLAKAVKDATHQCRVLHAVDET